MSCFLEDSPWWKLYSRYGILEINIPMIELSQITNVKTGPPEDSAKQHQRSMIDLCFFNFLPRASAITGYVRHPEHHTKQWLTGTSKQKEWLKNVEFRSATTVLSRLLEVPLVGTIVRSLYATLRMEGWSNTEREIRTYPNSPYVKAIVFQILSMMVVCEQNEP